MNSQAEGKSLFKGKLGNKWVITLVVLASGLLGFAAIYTISNAGNNQQIVSTAQTLPKSEPKISALGRLEPEGEVVKVASPSALGSSRIVKVLVKESDTVQLGQVIATLDSYDKSLATLQQAQAKVPEKESNLAQVKAGAKSGDIEAQRANYMAKKSNLMAKKANLLRLQQELTNATRDADRYQELFKSGATSAFTRDSFALKVKTWSEQIAQAQQEINQAEQEINQAQALLSSVSEVRPTEVAIAQAQLEAAIADVKKAQIDVDLAEVRAPIPGQILKVFSKPGEVVSTTNGVVEMGNTKQMYAVAEVYETDIGKVKVGQKATISSEVFKGEITGTVDRVGLRIAKNDILGTDPAAKTDVRVIEVKIRLNDSSKVSGLTNLQVKVKISV